MESELGGDHIADLARLQGKCDIFELLHHIPLAEPAEIAAGGRTGAIGILPGEFGKILRGDLFLQLADLEESLFLVIFRQFCEDMAGPDPPATDHFFRVSIVHCLDLILIRVRQVGDFLVGHQVDRYILAQHAVVSERIDTGFLQGCIELVFTRKVGDDFIFLRVDRLFGGNDSVKQRFLVDQFARQQLFHGEFAQFGQLLV